jgi:uncharacterized membrane protein YhaH (DUF805 family)
VGLLWLLFSFKGRIGRAKYWLGQFLAFLVFVLLIVAASEAQQLWGGRNMEGSPLLTGAIYALLVLNIYMSLAIHSKRFHDRGQSGWWQLIALVPFGGLYVLVVCGFLRGDEGPNGYGPDPLQRPSAGSLPPPQAVSETTGNAPI